MTNDSVPVQQRVGNLSGAKLRLLERLIEEKTGDAKEIRRCLRQDDPEVIRIPATAAQHRLWFIDQLEGDNGAYHVPLALRVYGKLDRLLLQAAFDRVIARHEALRTAFVKTDGEPMQVIRREGRLELRIADLRATDRSDLELEVIRQSQEELAAPFDLASGNLIRGRLLQLSEDEHVLLVVMHHIISDAWSIEVLIREFGLIYEALREGRLDQLPAIETQYADCVQWQRERLSSEEVGHQLRYWKEHLEGAPELLTLPADRPRLPIQSYRGSSVALALGRQLTADLKDFSRRFNVTTAMTLHTVWSVLLARLSGQEDVVVGIPVANRQRAEFESLIGYFVNTLAVRVKLDDDPSGADLLTRVREIMLGAYANQDAPFEQVVEALQPARSLSHSPIFQALFTMRNSLRAVVELSGLKLVEQEVPLITAQFDISLHLRESAEGIVGILNYATDVFDAATIERWRGYFECILKGMIREPHLQVSRLPLQSPNRQHELIDAFNATEVGYPKSKLIHQLFEEQVERTPYAVAVAHGNQYLTYRQLNGRANQLARYLKTLGVAPDRFVGLCLTRGAEMVVGMLGVLKAGGAYVPLDPSYPQQRLDYMIKDTAPLAILTERRMRESLPDGQLLVELDSDSNEISSQPRTNLGRDDVGVTSGNLAYAIYTSGSTGKPKGVAIEHRSAVNLMSWAHSTLTLEAFEQTLHATSLNFDLSVYETFVPLTIGGCIRVVQDALALLSENSAVTLINTVPSSIRAVLDAGRIPDSVRVVNLAGEPLSKDLVERIFAHSQAEQVINLYGPSETTTYSTSIQMTRDEGFAPTIGRPIFNTRVYILDRHRVVAPIGVIGEIYIGGAGVARGYLNQPELTAERFLSDPFSAEPGARMYRTGDLGRWRSDGTIEYVGRNDDQVKIRGFRIELAEIETLLRRHDGVREAVVIAREDKPGEKRLVAYLSLRERDCISVGDLRTYLKSALPEYMVPSGFVLLDDMPLTPNGKLDRRALPAPSDNAFGRERYEAPQGEIEKVLAKIWRDLLAVEKIGRHEDFFALGGHSLLATRVMSRLRELLQIEVPLRTLFDSSTLAQLAARLETEKGKQQEREAIQMDEFARDHRRAIGEMGDDEVLARIAELERELNPAATNVS